MSDFDLKIQEFIGELEGFAETAERTLAEIETDLLEKKAKFEIFFERMVAIRGTAQQLRLPEVARIAKLGEEISVKAKSAETRSQIRKCVGSLWDALTTIKYLLVHYTEKTTEEQEILVHRLEATLKAMGGARPSFDPSEIDQLLKQRR